MDISSSLLLAGLLLVLLVLYKMKNHKDYRQPPGPKAFPLVGNLPQLDKRAPFKSFMKLSETYGPVMTVYLGPQRAVVLVGYEVIKEALVDRGEEFTDRGPFPILIRATRGFGLVVSNGERWRLLRRFTLHTLKDFGMGRKGMEDWIQEESRYLMTRIEGMKAEPFDPYFFMSCTVSNVICGMVFGQRFAYEDKEFLKILHNIADMIKYVGSGVGQLYNLFPWLLERLPGPQHKMFALIEEIRSFIIGKITDHQKTLDPSDPRDFIDCFLNKGNQEKDDPSSEFHYNNLVSTVLNLFMAGTETTSTTLRFAMMVMIKYPNIQEHMRQEIDSVIGQERCPSMEDRKSLPFTDAVIHEIQRFLDLVPLNLPRYAMKDISFRGYTIPKGTLIIPMLHSVLKEKNQWDTPFSFNPQHFLDHNGNFKKSPAFMVFSAGKRACPGESLARVEIFIFLVSLLQRFTLSSPGGPESVDLTPQNSNLANMPRRYQLIATPR